MKILADKKHYYKLIEDFEFVPYNQSEGWYDYIQAVMPRRTLLFVDNPDHPTIACFGTEKKILKMRMLQIEGECFRSLQGITSKQIKSFYQDIALLQYDFIEINSEAPYNPMFEIGVREAGFLRPVGVFSCYLTKDINLQEPLKFSSNWKKNLKVASQHSFSFEVIHEPSPGDVTDFIRMYGELQKDKKFSHRFQESLFLNFLKDPSFNLAWLKNEKGEKLSSFVYYKRSSFAQSVFRAKIEKAKKNAASFEIYHRVLLYLREQRCEIFNMSRLAPGPDGGVSKFKEGITGNYYALNGEWSYYKKRYYRPLMYFVKKYLFKRPEK